MHPVLVLVFHAPASGRGPLEAALAAVRLDLAAHHDRGFRAAGAADVRIIADADDRPFGARLRAAAATLPAGAGVVVLGSGALPLADTRDRRLFVAAAQRRGAHTAAAGDARANGRSSGERAAGGVALASNRYSADAVAIPDGRRVLADLPDLTGDNALPRWLEERAGLPVADLRARRALQADLDGLTDLALLVRSSRCPAVLRAAATRHAESLAAIRDSIAAVEAAGADRRAEIVVAGRVSAAGFARLESATACRVRAIVEERGLRAADPRAQGADGEQGADGAPAAVGVAATCADATSAARPDPAGPRRPPASALGMLLDRDGPSALGPILARLGDAAIVDTRVLLAHRLGPDERAWPSLEDRLASDLGMAAVVTDPWLRALTQSAADAPIPVVLGAHSLVGPGLDLLFPAPRGTRSHAGTRTVAMVATTATGAGTAATSTRANADVLAPERPGSSRR